MEPLTDYSAYRTSQDRLADLRREADEFRLTRALADVHATLFPRARRFGAGVLGLTGRAPARRPAAAGRPCPC
jgi:hypothetical protein